MEACLCFCDYETFDLFRSKEVRARRSHRCCECSEEIRPGESYEVADAMAEGEFFHFKTCKTCARIRRDYCAPFGGLRDTLWETLGIDLCGQWECED